MTKDNPDMGKSFEEAGGSSSMRQFHERFNRLKEKMSAWRPFAPARRGVGLDDHVHGENEIGHLLQAFARDDNYRGNRASAYAVTMRNIFVKSFQGEMNFFFDQDAFTGSVLRHSRAHFFDENKKLAFAFLLASGTRDVADILRDHHSKFKSLKAQADRAGITEQRFNANFSRIASPEYGAFLIHSGYGRDSDGKPIPAEIKFLPETDAVCDVPFLDMITREEAEAQYERLLPAIHYVQKRIFDQRREAMSNTRNPNGILYTDNQTMLLEITAGELLEALRADKSEVSPAPNDLRWDLLHS